MKGVVHLSNGRAGMSVAQYADDSMRDSQAMDWTEFANACGRGLAGDVSHRVGRSRRREWASRDRHACG